MRQRRVGEGGMMKEDRDDQSGLVRWTFVRWPLCLYPLGSALGDTPIGRLL